MRQATIAPETADLVAVHQVCSLKMEAGEPAVKVYVSGPLSAGDWMVNLRAAVDAAEDLSRRGHVPYVPHLSMFWHLLYSHPHEFWLALDREWLEVCDAVLRLPGDSEGADLEVAWARELGKPVYTDVAQFPTAPT